MRVSARIAPDDAVLLTYVKPATNPLQAANGDDADAFSDLSITNTASWSPI